MNLLEAGAARSLLAALLATVTAGSAFAAEQVLMPYACRVQGGQVRLAPSADTFYRIYGVRDKEVYTACSPDDPSRCRNWLVHRFDLDCGGTRVGWMKVAEASARADRMAAWVDAGRMSLAMTPFWTIEREGPASGRGWWRRSRFERPYGDPDFIPHHRGGGVIVLPPGYAPVLSTGARFFEAPAPAPEKLPPPVKKPEVAQGAPASVKDNASAGTSAAPSLAKESAAAGAGPAASEGASASAKATAPGSTVTATIINKPGAATTAPAAATPPASDKAVPPGDSDIATGSLRDAPASGISLTQAGIAAALLLAATAFFWSRRSRAQSTDLARDPGRVSLGGLGRTGGLTTLGAAPSVPAAPRAASGDLAMPTSIAEALAVIGASSGASPDVIKKIVDGLRQSWHPDLARSDTDRAERERRMAQINVAWDILSGRQSAA